MNARPFLLLPLALVSASAAAQLAVSTAMTPAQLVQNVLLGNGVTAFNITFNGGSANVVNNQAGSFTANGTNIGLSAGMILGSGDVAFAIGPNNQGGGSLGGGNWGFSDPDLDVLSGVGTHDAAILEFDFIPTGDTLKFNYVFGSEEYDEYVCGTVNDIFGFFLSGPGIAGPFTNGAVNIALVPGTQVPVTINTVNNGTVGMNGFLPNCSDLDPNWQSNSIYYASNAGGATVQYDGMTVVLQARYVVVCGQTYHIKIAIADGGDTLFDSGVFLEAGSFTSTGQVIPTLGQSTGITGNTMLEGCNPVELTFTRLGDTTNVDTVDIMVSGTATPGVDYSIIFPSQLIFPEGIETITFTFDVPIDPDGPETIVFTIQQLVECAGQVIQTDFTFNIDSPPPLVVQSNNINGVCGQTHLLAPTVTGGMGQYTYDWSTGATTPTINVSPAVTTTYTVTVTDVCGIAPVSSDFTVTLPVYPPLTLEVTGDTLIDCLGSGPISAFGVTGGNNVFQYQWTLNGTPVGNTATITVPSSSPPVTYVVTVTEGCGSTLQDSVLVGTVPLDPIIITTAGDQTPICTGDTVTLTITGITGGNGVYSWRWFNQDGALMGNGWTLDVPVNANHAYTINANDQCGTEGSITVSGLVPIYPPFVLDVGDDKLLCAGDSTTIHALVTGGSGYYHILWIGPDSLTDPLYWVHPQQETTYSVTVRDQCGEELSDNITVDVEHVHIAILVNNMGQDDWYLQAQTFPYARTWIWDMGDGTRYRGDEVRHSYLDLEEHLVRLKIVTPNGCLAEDSVLLRPPAHIYFPNAFTPDGDGINELFGPLGHYIDKFAMTIFDRWGQVVFTTQDVNILWDGSVNGGADAMTGVYVYQYRAEGHYFPPVDGVGHVTLIRGSQD